MTLTKKGYLPRLIDKKINNFLKIFSAINLEGPKWCGKTWTALNHSNSVIYIGDPKNNFQNRTLAQLNPDSVLEGDNPRLLDEWQEVPSLWDSVRYKVDQKNIKGQYIMTGSATPQHKGILHSGTGRIGKIRMRPMSLFESGDSDGKISIIDIFRGEIQTIVTVEQKLEKLIYLAVRGGWPSSIGIDEELAVEPPLSYLKTVIEDDIYRIDGIKRDYNKIRLLLKALARNESTVVSNATLKKDIQEYSGEIIDVNTIAEYLNIFNRLFLIEDQKSFNTNIRSSVRVGKAPKRHFIDPSLAIAALEATPEMLLNDLNTFGFLFEAMCIRDLRIYAEVNGGNVFHYRDERGREIDAVIELKDGRWGAFEIKLGPNQIDEAAEKLIKIKEFMRKHKNFKSPAVLCVICGMTNIAYKRKDGVIVLPITSLRD
jgi:predicted AAA+ superfamily ATPase